MNDATLMNRVREMILSGKLAPGERITEAGLAAQLGVSRTPVRNMLPRLAVEGFLEPVGKRGFSVKAFSEQEAWEALELRAFLEALAVRTLAQKGASTETLRKLETCLAEGDHLFEKRHLNPEDEIAYGVMNARFHSIIVEAADSSLLSAFIERVNRVPFVAPGVIVFDQVGLSRAFEMLFVAHGCHHAIVQAVRERDAARAEALFREHAHHQRASMFERRRKNGSLPA